MVRSIFFFAQWFIARRRTWLHILTWITRFGYWLFILYGLLEWFRPRPIAEQIKRRKTLVYCLFSVILGSSVSWVIGKIWHRPRPFACGDAAALVPHKANASFPSNHSMNSLAILSNGCVIPSSFWLRSAQTMNVGNVMPAEIQKYISGANNDM